MFLVEGLPDDHMIGHVCCDWLTQTVNKMSACFQCVLLLEVSARCGFCRRNRKQLYSRWRHGPMAWQQSVSRERSASEPLPQLFLLPLPRVSALHHALCSPLMHFNVWPTFQHTHTLRKLWSAGWSSPRRRRRSSRRRWTTSSCSPRLHPGNVGNC